MATAVRMPYHRTTKGPSWNAIAPGEANIPWATLSLRRALRPRQGGASVDDERLPRDVARVIRKEEAHGVADVPARALHPQHGGAAAPVAGLHAHAALVDHGRVDGPRRHAVHADPVAAVVDCHGACESDDGTLGGGVGRQAARSERGDRRHVDDGAAAPADPGGGGVVWG